MPALRPWALLTLVATLVGSGCGKGPRASRVESVEWATVESRRLRQACPWLPALTLDLERSHEAERELAAAQKACDAKDAAGCRRLGTLDLEGDLVPQNLLRAHSRLEPLCRAGDYQACAAAGRAVRGLRRPSGVETLGPLPFDEERLVEPLTQACEHGVIAGCRELEDVQSWRATPRMEAAIERICADGKQPRKCWPWAKRLVRKREPAQKARAGELASRYLDVTLAACKAKDVEACRELVPESEPWRWRDFGLERRFQEIGAGYKAPPHTDPTPFAVLDLACAAGAREACWRLGGSLSAQGLRERAEPLLVAPCKAGDQRACLKLVDFRGMGHPEAKRLLDRACAYGFVEACLPLAKNDPRLARRACILGVCRDEAEFEPELTCVAQQHYCSKIVDHPAQPLTPACQVELLRTSCENGRYDNCGKVGEMYRVGAGVAKDPSVALSALSSACRGPSFGSAYDGAEWCEKLAGYLGSVATA